MRTRVVIALVNLLVASASAQTPVWRMDTTNLEQDVGEVRACLAEAADAEPGCLGRVRARCAGNMSPEASSTSRFQRACAWRAIAAWEDVLTEADDALRAELVGGELEAFDVAQTSWDAFVVANVRAHSERFAGGTLAGVVAAEERARMTALRALEVRRMIRQRRETMP